MFTMATSTLFQIVALSAVVFLHVHAHGGHDHDHGDAAHDHGHGQDQNHEHRDHKHYYTQAAEEEEEEEEEQHVHSHAHGDDGPPPAHGHTHDHETMGAGVHDHDHAEHDHTAHDHAEHDHSSHDHAEHDHSSHDHSSHDHDHSHKKGGFANKIEELNTKFIGFEATMHKEIDAYLLQYFPNPTMVMWVKALTSTAIISLVPAFLLIFIPIGNSNGNRSFLKVLLAFAAGGLLGDALLHLIPHALHPHDHGAEGEDEHDHSHSHDHGHDDHGHNHDAAMIVGLWVLAGILTFMILEKFARNVNSDSGGGHGHSHGAKNEKTDKKTDEKKEEKPQHIMKVTAYLNLAADFTHNFTDGLAMGAAFLNPARGPFKIFFAVLLHEVPHEVGDFAILVESGCTKWEAIGLQLTTALGAMCGTIVGLLSESVGKEYSAWILPFTAGGFIYIASVGVIPELLEDSTFFQSLMEVIAFCTGVAFMVLILYFE